MFQFKKELSKIKKRNQRKIERLKNQTNRSIKEKKRKISRIGGSKNQKNLKNKSLKVSILAIKKNNLNDTFKNCFFVLSWANIQYRIDNKEPIIINELQERYLNQKLKIMIWKPIIKTNQYFKETKEQIMIGKCEVDTFIFSLFLKEKNRSYQKNEENGFVMTSWYSITNPKESKEIGKIKVRTSIVDSNEIIRINKLQKRKRKLTSRLSKVSKMQKDRKKRRKSSMRFGETRRKKKSIVIEDYSPQTSDFSESESLKEFFSKRTDEEQENKVKGGILEALKKIQNDQDEFKKRTKFLYQ